MAHALFPTVWNWIEILIENRIRFHAPRPTPQFDEDGLRNQRDFINEIITRNPNAFSSDLDVHNMMSLFPEKF